MTAGGGVEGTGERGRNGPMARLRRPGLPGGLAALRDRLQARLSARARLPPGPFQPPEPRLAGDPSAGRRLLAGRVRLGEAVLALEGRAIWDLPGPEEERRALHACAWLDDLAALGGPAARALAQAWVGGWIERFGAGSGPGWQPALAAGRLLRWTGHAGFLLRAQDEATRARFARSLGGQALFLARRLRVLPPGSPERVEALAALVAAGLALPGSRALAREAALGLGREARAAVDEAGGVASRSPEALLDVLALLAGAARAMTEADLLADAAPASTRAIAEAAGRAAPVLRALRHADGGLARFHGGDRGAEGRLDAALAQAGRPGLSGRAGGRPALAMGFARLAAGRVTVIADAGAPPRGPASVEAHASALAFELTSGRRPLVVSCGSGRSFGAEWRRAGRATPSHSTLTLDGLSSSLLAPPRPGEAGGRLVEGPTRVIFEPTPLSDGLRIEMAHDGWRASHGLTHARTLQLAPDGGRLAGEDLLTTLTTADARALDRALDGALERGGLGLAVQVRFHLHPDVEAEALEDGSVALRLRSGEAWSFAQGGALGPEGGAQLSLEASAFLEEGAAAPRPAAQLVLATRATGPSTRLRWTLARTLGTSRGLRDLEPASPPDDAEEDA